MRADDCEKKPSYGYQTKPMFVNELRTVDWNQLRVEASLVALRELITEEESNRLIGCFASENSMRFIGKVAALIADGLVEELKNMQQDE